MGGRESGESFYITPKVRKKGIELNAFMRVYFNSILNWPVNIELKYTLIWREFA